MPRVANFADIIKIAIMFLKKTFKDSKKTQVAIKMQLCIKMQSISILLDIIKFTDFW